MVVAHRWFERYAWVLFIAMAALLMFEGVMGLAGETIPDENHFEPSTGRSWEQVQDEDPGMARYIKLASLNNYFLHVGLTLFLAVVAATAYRRGERWAWWLFWFLPIGGLGLALLRYVQLDMDTFAFTLPSVVISLAGLLLPVRIFFPTQRPGSAAVAPTTR